MEGAELLFYEDGNEEGEGEDLPNDFLLHEVQSGYFCLVKNMQTKICREFFNVQIILNLL